MFAFKYSLISYSTCSEDVKATYPEEVIGNTNYILLYCMECFLYFYYLFMFNGNMSLATHVQ